MGKLVIDSRRSGKGVGELYEFGNKGAQSLFFLQKKALMAQDLIKLMLPKVAGSALVVLEMTLAELSD